MWTSARAPRPWRRLFAAVTLLALLAPALAALAAYPVLDVNTGLTLDEGETSPITNSMLHVSMQNSPANGIRYQVTGTPTHGALLRSGVPLILGDSFTQDDINSGRLAYAHDGSETTSDSFAFRAADALRQPMTRVSLASDGTQGNGNSSYSGELSANGRFVAFRSLASNLVSGDTNGFIDVFVHDQQTGQTTRVSVASDGTQGNGDSYNPSISADGRFVAFESAASNLVSGDTNSRFDVFVHDQQTGQTTRVSVASDGSQSNHDSGDSSLSADGRFVGFQSSASNLVGGDTNGLTDAFVRDRQTGQTTRVSLASDGTQGNNGSFPAVLSADGRFVAFYSAATNLISGGTNGTFHVFVHDRQTGQTTLISVASDGTQGDDASWSPVISGDGRFVAFDSDATNLVGGDNNGVEDIFVHDRQTGQTTRVSVASDGTQANGHSRYTAALSGDGRFVLFNSFASNLVGGDNNGVGDVFMHDRQTGQTTLVSVASDGTQGNGGSSGDSLSSDGRFMAFDSDATNLVSGDTNTASDIFVADRGIAHSFAIGVIPANDRPTLSELVDQTTIRGSAPTLIPFQVGDGETSPDLLSVTTSSSNPALVPNANVFLGGGGANRSLAMQPLAGQTGQAVITIRVSDGNLSTARSFTFTVQPPPPAPPPPWLALLYLAGDDIDPQGRGQTGLTKPLEYLLSQLNAMPANPALRLVVLFDGDRPGDSALYVRQPGAQGLTRVASPSPWPNFSSELNSGSAATLRNFITWARLTYPGSPHTLLSIVDHGGGWAPDAGRFGQPRGHAMVSAGGWTGLAIDAQANNGTGASLSTKATGEALAGLGNFDVLFLDACLMGMIETATEVQPYADYLVAGENLLWSRLPYERYLALNVLTANTTPRALAQAIVQHYNQPTPADEPFTIAALELGRLPELLVQVNNLAQHLLTALDQVPTANVRIRAAYAAAQKFDYDSSFSQEQTDAYVDLADLAAQLLRPEHVISPEVTQAATRVRNQIVGGAGVAGVVMVTKSVSGMNHATRTTWKFNGAHGLSIYMPLGERDCRPTGGPISEVKFAALAPCAAPTTAKVGDLQIESQLSYYVRPEQLRFSDEQGAPQWAALLARLDSTTPNRAANRPRILSPFLAASHNLVYVPLLRR